MKKITFLLLISLFALTTNAQWTRTNVSIKENMQVNDLCEHDGNLYAAVFDSGLVKLNLTSNKWEKVQTSLPRSNNFAYISRLASTGDYLYAFVNNQMCASTMIYKSTDNGETFVADTSGHPTYRFPVNCVGYPASVANVFVLNGKLYTVINGGFHSKNPTDASWTKNTDPKVTFSELFGQHNSNLYAYSDNYKLHKSTDNGQSWTTPTNTGIPTYYLPKVLNVNPSTGRIYLAGEVVTKSNYILFYSDNEGESWDTLPINQYLGKNWMGRKQSVLGMISDGDDITILIENEANSSYPDVMKSTDGGQTFALDTAGLQPNASSTINLRKFLVFKNKLYMALNMHDIYVQGNGSSSVQDFNKTTANIYPNPVKSFLTIQNAHPIDNVVITNLFGKIVLTENHVQPGNRVDLTSVPAGIYFVRISSNSYEQVIKIVKQ